MRRLSLAVSPVIAGVVWLFGATAPIIDVALGLLAAWWLGLMVLRPGVFDQGSYVGMQWLPDAAWIAYVGALALLHLAALAEPRLWLLRAGASLASAWYWLLICISLSRHGVTTGTGNYLLWGLLALVGAIYVSGRSGARS